MAEIAAAGLGIAVVQTLLAALSCPQLKDLLSSRRYKPELQKLINTVNSVKNTLEDAESKKLPKETQGFIEDLKDAIYEADDLFDESVTLLQSTPSEGSLSKVGELRRKVHSFFRSNKNQVSRASKMLDKVKDIQNKLDAIADNHLKFKLDVNYEPILKRRNETIPCVQSEDIIGRDDDKKSIIDKLLEPESQGDVRFLTIVGVGGLGKTTLAQLVFNDEERIKKEFEDSRFWVCVSDQDKDHFDLNDILCKILQLVTGKGSFHGYPKELVLKQFQEKICEKKYLLILDDMWKENRREWEKFEKLLLLGQGGSRVLVTSRSEITAKIIGKGETYMLRGLSSKHSWRLFQKTAFGDEQSQQVVKVNEMEEIGKKIVKKCHRIPLALKVLGSLLYGQDISVWRQFEKRGLAEIDNGKNEIMTVLKLSYHNLLSSMKTCFCYCALFPKDYEIERRMLIDLWMAQNFIVPIHKNQSIEEAAEVHFSVLLGRCFFQDVKKDEYGEVESIKIHDLMHDVAQEVGGGEIQVVTSVVNNFGDKIRHMYVLDDEGVVNTSDLNKLRSLINVSIEVEDTLVFKCKNLRVLELYVNKGRELRPISNLHHLRYLDLSECPFEKPSSSITMLHNLQTLILCKCKNLRELPCGFKNLVKLRHLDLRDSNQLAHMPLGMDKLTSLVVLTNFVVGMKKKQCDDELKSLESFSSLTGGINIHIGKKYRNVEVFNDENGGYLSKMEDLKEVGIKFDENCVAPRSILKRLKPHKNLMGLVLEGYGDKIIPWWGREDDNNWAVHFCNLVKIEISDCKELLDLASFSKLPNLKSLKLKNLNLEYIEGASNTSRSKEAINTPFFRSLESLKIKQLGRLKGWFWKSLEEQVFETFGVDICNISSFKRRSEFPCLSTLKISECPSLTSFPRCASVKNIHFRKVQRSTLLLRKIMGQEGELIVGNRTSSNLATLKIQHDRELQNLLELEDICASSLCSLSLSCCYNLKSLSGLEHLTMLEKLSFCYCSQWDFSEIMPWKPLHQSLHTLSLSAFENWKSLPEGVKYLTSLRRLVLVSWDDLESLPEWISCLSSLEFLAIHDCGAIESLPDGIQKLTSLDHLVITESERLQESCRKPNGKDLKKIEHIRRIRLKRRSGSDSSESDSD